MCQLCCDLWRQSQLTERRFFMISWTKLIPLQQQQKRWKEWWLKAKKYHLLIVKTNDRQIRIRMQGSNTLSSVAVTQFPASFNSLVYFHLAPRSRRLKVSCWEYLLKHYPQIYVYLPSVTLSNKTPGCNDLRYEIWADIMNINVDAAQSQREWRGIVEPESHICAVPGTKKSSSDKGQWDL